MNGRETPPSDQDEVKLKSFDDFELTLGDIMRGERATLGKSLLDVQRDIKIKADYLAAIEDTNLAAFETPGFIGGYVKSYARYLGMNPDWAYRCFCEESGFSHVAGLDAQVFAKPPASKARPQAVRRCSDVGDAVLSRSPIYAGKDTGAFGGIQAGAIGSLIVLAALMGGLGYGGWTLLQQIQRVTLAPIDAQLTVASDGQAQETAALVVENTPPTAEALDRLYRPQALDTPVMVPRDGPIATLDPAGQGVFAGYTPTPEFGDLPDQSAPEAAIAFIGPMPQSVVVAELGETEIQVREAPPPEVVLFARRPSWVRVRSADGTVLLEKILEPGDRYVLPETELAPTLRAGNSGSLFFAVNGQTLGPAGQGTSVAKNVVLSAASLTETYVAPDMQEDPELARLAQLVIEPVSESAAEE